MTATSLGDFYPRPPGGGRHYEVLCKLAAFLFLSTPSGWRATVDRMPVVFIYRFLSTPSGWRATDMTEQLGLAHVISIHALRVEGDCIFSSSSTILFKFLSTPSGWRRLSSVTQRAFAFIFLSTPSGWRATASRFVLVVSPRFLSTPSGWRATAKKLRVSRGKYHFYPRPPGGGRHQRFYEKC